MTKRAAKRPLLKIAAAALMAASLSGCISLLPKTKPAQLYRFGVATAAPPARSGAVGVFRANGAFQREAAGDRMLTMTGERAAYIGEARWVAPAEVLFDEAVAAAFESAPGRLRLVSRGEQAHADYALRLDVRNFETDYGGGRAPAVLVRVRAVLSRDATRDPVAEQIFEARAPAAANRVGAIVAAYDKAVGQVLAQVIAWANSSVA